MDSYDASEAYGQIDGDSNYKYFYKVLAQDSFNRVTSYLSENGLVTRNEYASNGVLNNTTTGYEDQDNIRSLDFEYDISYNVTSRIDTKLNVSQNYFYDQHNRIQNVDIFYNNTLTSTNYSYDNVGNMTYNSDIGSYTYTKAHQVQSAGNRAYTYDANGNMRTVTEVNSFTSVGSEPEAMSQGDSRRSTSKIIEYTVSNKPSKLGDVEFFYNPNDDRYKKTEGNKTTHYIGKTYEKEISSNTHRYFIYANGKVVAIYDSTYKSIYLHYDALNSVDTITDTQGTVVQRKAYTAYGKEITTDDFFPYSTKRGYTGHEHIDDSLIHMNGRVYDSAIGRFISADPNIFHPFDPQDFNRYAYVRNNPLKYTDPSGFEWGDEEGGDDWSGNDSNAGSQSDAQDTENNEAGGDNTNDYSGDEDTTKSRATARFLENQLASLNIPDLPDIPLNQRVAFAPAVAYLAYNALVAGIAAITIDLTADARNRTMNSLDVQVADVMMAGDIDKQKKVLLAIIGNKIANLKMQQEACQKIKSEKFMI